MIAMILAAGRGRRMEDLTNDKPKPLLMVNGKSLIEYQIISLAQNGFKEIIINVAYHGQKIIDEIGFGEKWGVDIKYSYEGEYGLETGGGIRRALPLLGNDFIVVNADVWTEYPYSKLKEVKLNLSLAYLVLVNNPEHNPQGDFSISENNTIEMPSESTRYTFSGIGLYSSKMFTPFISGEKFSLLSIFKPLFSRQKIKGELYTKTWQDIGTPERLKGIRCD